MFSTQEYGTPSPPYGVSIDGPMAGMASVADATAEAFEKQLKAMELQVAELTEAEYIVQRMRWEADGFTDAQIEQLDRQAEFIRGLKEEQELLKKNADEAKRLSDEMDRDLSRSISAANEYFQKLARDKLPTLEGGGQVKGAVGDGDR